MARAALLVTLLALAIAGCASRQPAPVTDRMPVQARTVPPPGVAAKPAPRAAEPVRAEVYVVKQGDTLYSIALDHGLDYRELAAWNNLENVSVIRVGQQLRLTPPQPTATAAPQPGVSTAPLRMPGGKVESRPLDTRGTAGAPLPGPGAAPRLKTGPKAARVPYSDEAWAQASRSEAAVVAKAEPKPDDKPEAKPAPRPEGAASGTWTWPASGKIIGGYNGSTRKGIEIAGKLGDPIVASEGGRVIFSGTGIRGMGKFVVIKHNNDYISVYAHQSEILVKQDQTVAKGQRIGAMGSTESDQVKLHFEIRRYGKPVDPLTLLPDRG